MVNLPFQKRCHICGSREALRACVICGKRTCQLHIVGGKCHRCLESETLQGAPKVAARRKDDGSQIRSSVDLHTKIKIPIDSPIMLADLYVLLGGRPGSKRSTTTMGSLHLDQHRHNLMFDRQVARRINLTTFVRVPTQGIAEVETHKPQPVVVDGYRSKEGNVFMYNRDMTIRVAHDQVIRMIDLISRALSSRGIQTLGGDPLLEVIELNEEMACPYCGNWLEVCQCPQNPMGNMTAPDYFRIAAGSKLNQMRITLKTSKSGEMDELRDRVARWQRVLETR